MNLLLGGGMSMNAPAEVMAVRAVFAIIHGRNQRRYILLFYHWIYPWRNAY